MTPTRRTAHGFSRRRNPAGYGEIVAALTPPANVKKITGENWFRVLDAAKA